MAIKKEKTNNQGIKYEYWVAQPIIDAKRKTTSVLMLGFVSKEARDNGANFVERVRVRGELDGVYPTGEEIYSKVKESKIVNCPVEATIEEIEADGYKQQYEDVETNWFADAVDC